MMEKISNTFDKAIDNAVSPEIRAILEQPLQPVIKLSFEGFLLFANNQGVEFLDVLSDYTRKPALTYLFKKYPQLLSPDSNTDICIQLYETCFYFSVVAFREGGYTGLYGYRSVRKSCGDSLVA